MVKDLLYSKESLQAYIYGKGEETPGWMRGIIHSSPLMYPGLTVIVLLAKIAS